MNYEEMTTDELEVLLPIEFQRKEMRERACGEMCPFGQVEQTVTYVRNLNRHDDGSNGNVHRCYFIAYSSYNGGDGFFTTTSCGTLREALIEMCRKLTGEGIISCKQEAR